VWFSYSRSDIYMYGSPITLNLYFAADFSTNLSLVPLVFAIPTMSSTHVTIIDFFLRLAKYKRNKHFAGMSI
jgi:hypothetical protein